MRLNMVGGVANDRSGGAARLRAGSAGWSTRAALDPTDVSKPPMSAFAANGYSPDPVFDSNSDARVNPLPLPPAEPGNEAGNRSAQDIETKPASRKQRRGNAMRDDAMAGAWRGIHHARLASRIMDA